MRHTHVTVPFDRLAGELNLPLKGIIPAGAFVTVRPQPAPGWDAAGLPVPSLTARRARVLYERGIIGPKPSPPQPAVQEALPITRKSSHGRK